MDPSGGEDGTMDAVTALPTLADQLVDLHRHLVRIVTGVSGDPDLAEEASQEALARLWEAERAGRAPDNREAWATRVALNWTRSWLRRRGAERRAVARLQAKVPAAGPIDHDGPYTGLSLDVRRAVLALPYRQREVVVLHYLADLDITSIAAITGTSEGAVKNALFHGRKALGTTINRKTVEGEGP